MSDADTLPTLALDLFDLMLLKSAVLCYRAHLRCADQPLSPQGMEDIDRLQAVFRQLQSMHQQGAQSSDLLTGPALRVLDGALGYYIATMQQSGEPSAEPDEILAGLYLLRQELQPLLPPTSQDLADDLSEEP